MNRPRANSRLIAPQERLPPARMEHQHRGRAAAHSSRSPSGPGRRTFGPVRAFVQSGRDASLLFRILRIVRSSALFYKTYFLHQRRAAGDNPVACSLVHLGPASLSLPQFVQTACDGPNHGSVGPHPPQTGFVTKRVVFPPAAQIAAQTPATSQFR